MARISGTVPTAITMAIILLFNPNRKKENGLRVAWGLSVIVTLKSELDLPITRNIGPKRQDITFFKKKVAGFYRVVYYSEKD